jgi:hypothetical protein
MGTKWSRFRAAVAFVKRSGVRHIYDALSDFAARGTVKISVGVDCGGTSREGLHALFDSVKPSGEVWVFHNDNDSTFHPKIYLFSNEREAELVIGSGNLTEGGLFTNYEAAVHLRLDLHTADHVALLHQVDQILDTWAHPEDGTAIRVDDESLKMLEAKGYLPPEAYTRRTEEVGLEAKEADMADGTSKRGKGLFQRVAVPSAPKVQRETRVSGRRPRPAKRAPGAGPRVFLMTLQQTDVGRGQTTAGTSQRSPEIFIPLVARDFAPEFWGWPDKFVNAPAKAGKKDRMGVRMLIGTDVVVVNMMYWPAKHDLRLRNETLRSSAAIGDIMRIERVDTAGYEYHVVIIPKGSSQYADAKARCTKEVRNSRKEWGYI